MLQSVQPKTKKAKVKSLIDPNKKEGGIIRIESVARMDVKDFLDFGKATVDFIANYTETLRDRPVLPDVEPGYLSQMIPEDAPMKAETWQEVFKDIERVIMPGMTHWNSPNFYAYYPCSPSYASMVGELLCAGFGGVGFSWICSPVFTELEVITLNWLGKILNLPSEFLNCSDGPGGGVIQGSASETTFVCLLAAKDRKTRSIKNIHPDWDEGMIRTRLVAYGSEQANSSVEKAGLLATVQMKLLPTDENGSLRGETLLKAIKKDLENGLIPCFVCGTLGTTGTCALDNLNEIGPICNQYDVWLHIDAAYVGAAFACPEYRHLMKGVHYADSFNVNCHKWLLVNFDCSAMWVKNSKYLIEALSVDRIYLAYDKQGVAPDYRHWQIQLGRRFRSLKLWFVLRLNGIEGIQKHIRTTVSLANKLANYIKSDDRFELVTNTMALVSFRLEGDNDWTKELLTRLTERKRIYVIIAMLNERYIIRFCVNSPLCKEQDIEFAWNEISEQATEILQAKHHHTVKEIIIQPSVKLYDDITLRIENINLDRAQQLVELTKIKMNISFEGKRILVTGAGQGIGKDLALRLSKYKAEVIALSKTKENLNQLFIEDSKIVPVCVDLNDWNATRKAIEDILPIDLLVNNAGVARLSPFLDATEEDFNLIFNINVKAIMNVSQVVAKNMIERNVGGSIVNVSSQASQAALKDHAVYCSSKGAVDMLTK
ncbi:hypothetical protein M0802_008006 [Mischocyttarus mexicanus]|nr:hypothetical protein M0802_008006 [Mischocyttarus mexicanus]